MGDQDVVIWIAELPIHSPVLLDEEVREKSLVEQTLDLIHQSWLKGERENHALASLHLLREFCIAEHDASESLRSDLEINPTDLDALLFTVDAPETTKVTLRVLGEHLGITSASTTALVHRLIAAGYLTSEVDILDRRARNLTATPAARTMVVTELRIQTDTLLGAAGSFQSAELETVAKYLEAVIDAIRPLDDGVQQARSPEASE